MDSDVLYEFLELEKIVEKEAMILLEWYQHDALKKYKYDDIDFEGIEDDTLYYEAYKKGWETDYYTIPLKFLTMSKKEREAWRVAEDIRVQEEKLRKEKEKKEAKKREKEEEKKRRYSWYLELKEEFEK